MKVTKDFIIDWVQRIPEEDEKFLETVINSV